MKRLRILSQDILRNHQTLESRLKVASLKIAVVGNSGITKNDDKIISDCDIVIRFNNYATRGNIKHTADRYRCDILFSTFDLHSVGSKPKDVVIGIPYPFKAHEIYNKPNKWYPDSRLWMVNPYENMKMCEEMGINSLGYSHPLPSIGFTALWHIKDWRASFFIAGFGWYYDETKNLFQGHHLSNKKYPSHWNHNYPKEVEWMLKTLRPKNNIIFSDSCSRILDQAQKQLA